MKITIDIPAAAIIDLDAIATDAWNGIFDVMALRSTERTELEQRRSVCASYLNALPLTSDNQKAFKVKGILSLGGEERRELTRLIDDLATYGIFVVEVGEVEGWLSTILPNAAKGKWLQTKFTALGSDPLSADYVTAGTDDVWRFVDKISRWVNDSSKRGIP